MRGDEQRGLSESAGAPPPEALWIQDPAEWARHREAWDEVLERSARPCVFQTWDFLECSWLHFARPRGHALAIIALSEGGRLVAFAPFQVSTRRQFGLSVRRLGVLAAWEADRVPPLIAPAGREAECASAVLSCLETRADGWDYIELRELSSADPLGQGLDAWATRTGRRCIQDPTSPSPYALLDAGCEHGMKGLGPATRKSLRRYRRKLEAIGPCTLEALDTPDQMERALGSYLDLESRSWKREEAQGVGKNEANRVFYSDLLPRLARKGRAVVSLLTQGGKPIAGTIDLRLGDTAYGSHATYDEAHASFSPGNVLNGLSFEWHAAHGVRRYELYAQFLGNKMRWASATWSNVTLRVFQTRGLRRALLFAPGLLRAALSRRKPNDDAGSGSARDPEDAGDIL